MDIGEVYDDMEGVEFKEREKNKRYQEQESSQKYRVGDMLEEQGKTKEPLLQAGMISAAQRGGT